MGMVENTGINNRQKFNNISSHYVWMYSSFNFLEQGNQTSQIWSNVKLGTSPFFEKKKKKKNSK